MVSVSGRCISFTIFKFFKILYCNIIITSSIFVISITFIIHTVFGVRFSFEEIFASWCWQFLYGISAIFISLRTIVQRIIIRQTAYLLKITKSNGWHIDFQHIL